MMVLKCISCLALICFFCSPFLGEFIYLQDCSYSVNGYCPATLSSPLISLGARLKCLQFRLFGWFSVLEVSLVSKFKVTKRQFFADRSWRRMHMAINEDFPYQVNAIL